MVQNVRVWFYGHGLSVVMEVCCIVEGECRSLVLILVHVKMIYQIVFMIPYEFVFAVLMIYQEGLEN